MRSPILLLHIIAGTLGMLSGFVTVFLRKGSRRHRLAGNVFVISMLTLSASAAYLASMKQQMGNFLGGVFTFYLVSTAWLTARRRDGETGVIDWIALLAALAVGIIDGAYGFAATFSPTGLKGGYPAGIYFFSASVALLAATGDIRMLIRGGVSETQRLMRHLWRMCYALFVAAGSIFLARQQLFPDFLRKTGVLIFLSFLPLLLMIFWLVRVRFANAYRRRAPVMGGPQPSLSAG